MANIYQKLILLGFVDHEHVPHFGSVLRGVDYLYKKVDNCHIYISLVNYDGVFCEAICEKYVALKNTRVKGVNNKPNLGELSAFHKKGFLPIEVMSFRSENELFEYLK